MGNIQPARGSGVVGTSQYVGRTKWARAYYDFATDAGDVGTITLRGDALPTGALILSALIKVETAVVTASSGTVSLGVQSAADLRAAAVPSGTTVLSAVATVQSAHTRDAAPLVMSADKSVVATVATGAITAGRFSVLVEYIELESAV